MMLARSLFKPHKQAPQCASVLGLVLAFCMLTSLCASASSVLAQSSDLLPSVSVVSPKLSTKDSLENKQKIQIITSKPEWKDLTQDQKLSLKPLADNWVYLGDAQKRKWLAISVNFQALAPVEQAKLHSRMNDWVSLSQQQRSQARLSFAQSKQLSQSHKAASWQAYQALSQDEKLKLGLTEKHKQIPGTGPSKPSERQKLALAPVKPQNQRPASSVVAASLVVDRNTLLPHALVLAEPSAPQKN